MTRQAEPRPDGNAGSADLRNGAPAGRRVYRGRGLGNALEDVISIFRSGKRTKVRRVRTNLRPRARTNFGARRGTKIRKRKRRNSNFRFLNIFQ